MRKPLLLATALALLPLAPALAQTAPPPAAPKLELTADQRAELQTAVARGRMLAAIDAAGRIASSDARARIPAAEADQVVGWIAEPEGNGVGVTYFVRDGDGYAAIYKGQVLGGRVTSPQVYEAGSRPALAGNAAKMAAARVAAAAVDNEVCNASAFNYLVLPPEQDGSVLVYQMSPRMAADRVPGGGYYRVPVAADGTAGEAVALAETCVDLRLPPVAAGQRPRPLIVNARDALLPNEMHVFLALSAQRPVAVAAGAGDGSEAIRMWGVSGEGIAELQQ